MKLITILVCKALAFVGKLIGKGTSLPGSIALKLCPDILSRLTLPEYVIAVTGSNGKTSCVEMIAKVFAAAGKTVVYNKEGSNQTEGVTTLLLKHATLGGKVRGDVVLLETDERYARRTFRFIKPTHFVITNLYRDQMTRNAHPFFIYDIVKDAVDLVPDAQLILNADDPIVRNFGFQRENVRYFGMDRNAASREETDALYNDCHYCPRCQETLEYDFFHYAHLGSYRCPTCGYSRPDTHFTVTDMDLEDGHMDLDGSRICLEFTSKYNVYNLCAAYAAARLAGVEKEQICAALNEFVMQNGRVLTFRAGENRGMLLTSKHENSTSYNQSLQYVASRKAPTTLVVIVDAVSRKYYTSEVSWLWDISFELLADSQVERIILSGKYAYDLALRLQFAGLEGKQITVEPDLDKMGSLLKEPVAHELYCVTCFSDKDKLLNRVDSWSTPAK